jgi:hypothetical protein
MKYVERRPYADPGSILVLASPMVQSGGVCVCHQSSHPAPARMFFSCSIGSARDVAGLSTKQARMIPITRRSFALC